MKQSKQYFYITALSFSIFLSSPGCVVNKEELVRLQDELAVLNAKQKKDAEKIILLEDEINKSRKQLRFQSETLERKTKRNRAGSEADMETLRAEFGELTGRFEETQYISNKTSTDFTLFLEASEERLSEIEKTLESQQNDINALNSEMEALKVSEPAYQEKEETGKKAPAKQIYKEALQLIQNKKPAEARKGFKNYLNQYPNGPLAGNALFWIGECYYAEKSYERAIVEYDNMMKKYPKGVKVPAAMLKQAMSFDKIKDKKTARALFDRLIKNYPGSEEAKTAKKILKKSSEENSKRKK